MSQTAPDSFVIRPPAEFTVPPVWITEPAFARLVPTLTFTPPATLMVSEPVFRTCPPAKLPAPSCPPVQVLPMPVQVNVRPWRTLTVPPLNATVEADESAFRVRLPLETVSPPLNAAPLFTVSVLVIVTAEAADRELIVTGAFTVVGIPDGMTTSFDRLGTTPPDQLAAVLQFEFPPPPTQVTVVVTVDVRVKLLAA
jgi:hypothetical protein